MEKTRHVNYRRNASLGELYRGPGELIAFDNSDWECPSPFVLAILEKMVKIDYDPKKDSNGHNPQGHGIVEEKNPKYFTLIFKSPDKRDPEKWALYAKTALGLWSPTNFLGKMVPHTDNLFHGKHHPYFVEDAYSGKDAIQKALSSSMSPQGFNFYAECLQSGELVVGRGKVGKLAENLGLGALLRPEIRFRHYRT